MPQHYKLNFSVRVIPCLIANNAQQGICEVKMACCLSRWKEAGLDCLEVVAGSVASSVKQVSDACLRVEASWRLRPSEDEALRAADIGSSGVSEVLFPMLERGLLGFMGLLGSLGFRTFLPMPSLVHQGSAQARPSGTCTPGAPPLAHAGPAHQASTPVPGCTHQSAGPAAVARCMVLTSAWGAWRVGGRRALPGGEGARERAGSPHRRAAGAPAAGGALAARGGRGGRARRVRRARRRLGGHALGRRRAARAAGARLAAAVPVRTSSLRRFHCRDCQHFCSMGSVISSTTVIVAVVRIMKSILDPALKGWRPLLR